MKTRSELVARVQELEKVIEKMESEKPWSNCVITITNTITH